jgi:DNA polymerase-1
MITALIDGDILAYEASSANEYNTQWDTHCWTRHADLDSAVRQLDDKIEHLAHKAEADDIIIAISASGGDYFRRKINPSEYKSNRNQPKPVIYQPLRDYMLEVYTTFERPGLEGDDVLGILSTHPTLIEGKKVVVSVDKDMLTFPGFVLNPNKLDEGVIEVTQAQADYNFYKQILTGDPVDGYKGCPGVGKVRAAKILAPYASDEHFDCAGAWQAIIDTFHWKMLGREVALMNARMARILRAEDYEVKTRKIKLWEPPV